jgi:hypothetical protein
MRNVLPALVLAVIAMFGSVVSLTLCRTPAIGRDSQLPNQTKPRPVEKDMHEFMEYVFEPTYQRLKQSMASEPADNPRWKRIKSDALILAEGGNLLLLRTPPEDSKTWDENSAAVRDLGGKLYASAKKKDYPSARRDYEAMLVNCNACHTKFAKGEHQLTP